MKTIKLYVLHVWKKGSLGYVENNSAVKQIENSDLYPCLKIRAEHIEGFRTEWCISTVYRA